MDEKVRILDAFGDALVGKQLAEVIVGEERGEILGCDVGIDGHRYSAASRSRNSRGSGKNTLASSAAVTLSTRTS